MNDITGMVEVDALRGTRAGWRCEWLLSSVNGQPVRCRRLPAAYNQEPLDTMATEDAPHLVGLLADGHGFGRIGDHGGPRSAGNAFR